ncbi:acetylglutamate kinase [Paraferrimonas sedimenticola]|uniref:Acetylglutamate kinase n=1 Tax=Paraferrimonas sedimenticola TaxID=375674 RepID=A0AA37RWI1_9GAMM|nr:acetylglutamate kinase [Paraferrimonas sedimenticola]GLP95987.1 acetylglutamate kinase [Paraferrimonas sedimenticola]
MSTSTWVIKVGGELLSHPEQTQELMQTIAALQAQGVWVVLVHGGGDLAEAQLSANGFVSQKHQGLRVTPAEQMPVVAGALAGTANKILQAAAIKAGLNSLSVSLADANLVTAKIKDPALGLVGEVSPNDASLCNWAKAQGQLLIVSSIAANTQGQLLNVNADQAAAAIAELTQGQLLLLSNVAGVLDGAGELIETLSPTQAQTLIQQAVIRDGMQVKVQAAQALAKQLQQAVVVGSWSQPQQLLNWHSGQAFGTQVLPH